MRFTSGIHRFFPFTIENHYLIKSLGIFLPQNFRVYSVSFLGVPRRGLRKSACDVSPHNSDLTPVGVSLCARARQLGICFARAGVRCGSL
jgi:hypothetical protein